MIPDKVLYRVHCPRCGDIEEAPIQLTGVSLHQDQDWATHNYLVVRFAPEVKVTHFCPDNAQHPDRKKK